MLHIFLNLLKCTGILLAVLLILVLFLVLSVVFAPVRYQGGIVKTEETAQGYVKAVWLLHLVSVTAGYDWQKAEKKWMVIRIFGVRLETCRNIIKRLLGRKKRHRKRREDNRSRKKKNSAARKNEGQQIRSEIKKQPTNCDGRAGQAENTAQGQPDYSVDAYMDAESPTAENNAQGQPERKFLHKWKKIGTIIKVVPQKLHNLAQKTSGLINKTFSFIKKLIETPGKLYEKSVEVADKFQTFRQMAEEYEVKAVFGALLTEAKVLISHYGPRRAKGCIRFGTGDPALTGELTGVLYGLLPARAGQVLIQPEFTETVFEADLMVSGHIRVCHLLRTGWHLLRNRKLKRLIAKWKETSA